MIKNTFIRNEPAQIWRNYFSDSSTLDYHLEFFSAGITAIVQKQLNEGCPGEPESMSRIIYEEYNR